MFRATIAFRERTVYTQVRPGWWRAEFHGAFDVTVEAPSIERCRSSVLDAFDGRLADWILSTSKVPAEEQTDR